MLKLDLKSHLADISINPITKERLDSASDSEIKSITLSSNGTQKQVF